MQSPNPTEQLQMMNLSLKSLNLSLMNPNCLSRLMNCLSLSSVKPEQRVPQQPFERHSTR